MKIVQMTLDEALVEAVDEAAKRLGTTRSGFTREALRQAIARLREASEHSLPVSAQKKLARVGDALSFALEL